MKKLDLGQTISIFANLGVIAGIVFLGYELRQNQVVGQAQTRNEITRMFVETSRADISTELIEIFVKQTNGEPLNQAEEMRLGIWADIWLQLYENLDYQARVGLYESDEAEAIYREMSAFVNNAEPFRDRFCEFRYEYTDGFQARMDNLLDVPCD